MTAADLVFMDRAIALGNAARGTTAPNPNVGWSGAGLNLHLSEAVVRNCIFTGDESTEGGGLWVGGQGDGRSYKHQGYGRQSDQAAHHRISLATIPSVRRGGHHE